MKKLIIILIALCFLGFKYKPQYGLELYLKCETEYYDNAITYPGYSDSYQDMFDKAKCLFKHTYKKGYGYGVFEIYNRDITTRIVIDKFIINPPIKDKKNETEKQRF
jgi:hypothetical protein